MLPTWNHTSRCCHRSRLPLASCRPSPHHCSKPQTRRRPSRHHHPSLKIDCNSTVRNSADCRNESVGPFGEWSLGSHHALARLFASGKLLEGGLWQHHRCQLQLLPTHLVRRQGFSWSNTASEMRRRELIVPSLLLPLPARETGCWPYSFHRRVAAALRSDRCKPSAHPRTRMPCKLPRGARLL